MSRASPAARLVPLVTALVACAPTLHTIEPYRSDPAEARALESRAREVCAHAPEGPREAPTKRFISDGCSIWPDDGWVDPCCIDHDIHYWCGGEASERAEADAALRACVEDRAPAWLAWLMWLGVRVGGHPVFPVHYRWGYGRSYLPWYGEYPACTEAGEPAPGAEPAECSPDAKE